ncbi:MAG: hypothetical protein FWE16_01405 [Firmicutes bacterium]|nr:hypothetical protein [Bacillota bacterium]
MTPLKKKLGWIGLCVGIFCVNVIAVTSVFILANRGPVAGDPTPPTPPPSFPYPNYMQHTLLNLDGTINGQVAANILRDLNSTNTAVNYRGTIFRLMSTYGVQFPGPNAVRPFALSTSLWRIVAVEGNNLVIYSTHGYNVSFLNDIRTTLNNDFNSLPNEIRTNPLIIPTGNRPDGGAGIVGDRLWLPSLTELNQWSVVNQRHGRFRQGGWSSPPIFNFYFAAWLRSGNRHVIHTGSSVTTLNPHQMTQRQALRPAMLLSIPLLQQAAQGYTERNRYLFDVSIDGSVSVNEDVRLFIKENILESQVASSGHVHLDWIPFRFFPNLGDNTTSQALSQTYFSIGLNLNNATLHTVAVDQYVHFTGIPDNARVFDNVTLLDDWERINTSGRFNQFLIPATETVNGIFLVSNSGPLFGGQSTIHSGTRVALVHIYLDMIELFPELFASIELPANDTGFAMGNFTGITRGTNFFSPIAPINGTFTFQMTLAPSHNQSNPTITLAQNGTLGTPTRVGDVLTFTVTNVTGPITEADWTVSGVNLNTYNVASPTTDAIGITFSGSSVATVQHGGSFTFTMTLTPANAELVFSLSLLRHGSLSQSRIGNVITFTVSNVSGHITPSDYNFVHGGTVVTVSTGGSGDGWTIPTTSTNIPALGGFTFTLTLAASHSQSNPIVYLAHGAGNHNVIQTNRAGNVITFTVTNVTMNINPSHFNVANVVQNTYNVTSANSGLGFTITQLSATTVEHGGHFSFVLILDENFSNSNPTLTFTGPGTAVIHGSGLSRAITVTGVTGDIIASMFAIGGVVQNP